MEDKIVKNLRNHFKLKAIKERIITYLGNLFELEEGYCKPVRLFILIVKIILHMKVMVIEITLSIEECLNEIRRCLKDIINNLIKYNR